MCDVRDELGPIENTCDVLKGNGDDIVNVSIGTFRWYHSSLGPYCTYMWTTLFDPSYNFSEAFDKGQMIFIFVGVILLVASCLQFFELWSQDFDNRLHALMLLDVYSRILSLRWAC